MVALNLEKIIVGDGFLPFRQDGESLRNLFEKSEMVEPVEIAVELWSNGY